MAIAYVAAKTRSGAYTADLGSVTGEIRYSYERIHSDAPDGSALLRVKVRISPKADYPTVEYRRFQVTLYGLGGSQIEILQSFETPSTISDTNEYTVKKLLNITDIPGIVSAGLLVIRDSETNPSCMPVSSIDTFDFYRSYFDKELGTEALPDFSSLYTNWAAVKEYGVIAPTDYNNEYNPKVSKYPTTNTTLRYNANDREFVICAKFKHKSALASDIGFSDESESQTGGGGGGGIIITPKDITPQSIDDPPAWPSAFVLSTDAIISYNLSYDMSGSVNFGSVLTTSFTLEITREASETAMRYLKAFPDMTAVYMFIGYRLVGPGSPFVWDNFGAWAINEVTTNEQSCTMTISGNDILADTKLEAVLGDDVGDYTQPVTHSDLFSRISTSMNLWSPEVKASYLISSTPYIRKKPDVQWENAATMVNILSALAQANCGFVYADLAGRVHIHSYADVYTFDLNPEMYYSMSFDIGATFALDGIILNDEGADDPEQSAMLAFDANGQYSGERLINIPPNLRPSYSDTVSIAKYPLLSDSYMITTDDGKMVSEVVDCLSYTGALARANLNDYMYKTDGTKPLNSGELDWIGDPAVTPGSILRVEALDGTEKRFVVLGQTISFDAGGLRSHISSRFDPAENGAVLGYTGEFVSI